MRLLSALVLCFAIPGCGVATATETPAAAAAAARHAEDQQGRYRLVFELPRASWRADEAIDGRATLSVANGGGVDLGGSGGGLVGFGFAQVGGPRHVDPGWDTDCSPYRLEPGKPVTSAIKKSGAFSDDQPDAAFYRAFLADPVVRLPAGDWTISAVASFVEGKGCSGASRMMTATVTVHITP
jgi:hypothetical protein